MDNDTKKQELDVADFGSTGQKIRRVRERKGVAAPQLAAKCGITKGAMSLYENGLRQVSDEKRKSIADVLGVTDYALKYYNLNDVLDVLYSLFEMEDKGYISPDNISSTDEFLNEAIEQWSEQRNLWIKDQISDNEYHNWKDTFAFYSTSEHDTNLSSNDDPDSLQQNHLKRGRGLMFLSLNSRLVSLSHSLSVSSELQERICNYVNCSVEYLNDRNQIHYIPDESHRNDATKFDEVIFDILNIMDVHADTEYIRTIQIQLSRVVLYHLAQKGILLNAIPTKEISKQKIDFLYDGTKPRFNAFEFGLYYTELAIIREMTGITYQEMFTGLKSE